MKRFKKITWIRSHHLQLQWKFKLLAGKFTWENKAKHCWMMSTNFLFSKVCWLCPAMFCLYNSSKLSRPWFEFSLKVKVMGLNPGYILKYFLLYYVWCRGKDCISSPKMKNWTFLQKVKNQWNTATAFSYYVLVKTLYFWQ